MNEPAQRYAAFWRGINIGRAKRLAMADLRKVLQDLGFGDVRTLLNSGNAVFTGPQVLPGEAASSIQEAIAERLGVFSRVTVLTAAELHGALAADLLYRPDRDPSRQLIAVLADGGARARVEHLLAQDWTPEELALGERVAYMWCPLGFSQSRLIPPFQRALGDAVTTRTWATMARLDALAAALPT
jgi:uncharacterized protein (DUF1697 family)